MATNRESTEYIVIHSSATPPSADIGVAQIRQWHTDPPPAGRGWSDVGYHYVIRRTGEVEIGRPKQQIGSHVRGFNVKALGICLVGGVKEGEPQTPENNFLPAQWASLERLVWELKQNDYPNALVVGHRDIAHNSTHCPSFDVDVWWAGRQWTAIMSSSQRQEVLVQQIRERLHTISDHFREVEDLLDELA